MEPITQPSHLHRPGRALDAMAVVPSLSAGARRLASACLPLAFLLALSLPGLTYRLAVYPPIWFDEGYRTNAARTLAVTGVYGTSTSDGVLPYDTGISTGPADILPMALSYRLFGSGIVPFRLVSVAFTLLAIAALYAIARRTFGEGAGLFSVVFVLAFPAIQGVGLLLIGRQVLGEMPAMALISLGLWLWFKSWPRAKVWMAAAAGVCIGFGLLSKTQVAFGLLPALIVIGLLRSRARRGLLIANLPWIVAVLVMAGWGVWSGLDSPPETRLRNAQMLTEAIRTQLLTGQWGRWLDRPALAMTLLMLGVSAAEAGRLFLRRRIPGFPTEADWGSALLLLFVLSSSLWFALFSIGWPRYATAGFLYALLLLGRLVWNSARATGPRLIAGWARRAKPIEGTAIALLGLLTLPLTLAPIHLFRPTSDAQAAADYVSVNIPREAVVESWTWELDALSDHWQFHHPDLSYLYLAERQAFHDESGFSLDYDTLQADPDYLISGPFSQWVSLYDPEVIRTSFRRATAFGQYVIFERLR